MDSPKQRHIVIVGGGIIGCTTAYFLTRHARYDPATVRVTVLEATAIASGASGKAGGLLALWAYPSCLVPLSYRLHRELAAEHGGADKWGYRRIGCGSVAAAVKTARALERGGALGASKKEKEKEQEGDEEEEEGKKKQNTEGGEGTGDGEDASEWAKLPKQNSAAAALLRRSGLPADLDWLDAELVERFDEMGVPGATETAQVHPFHFTNAIAALAKDKGVEFRLGAKVTKIESSPKAGVEAVEYLERRSCEVKTITHVTDVVVAAGPWTGRVLPRSKVEGLRAHSVVLSADVSPYAVFTDIQLPTDYVPAHRARKGQKRRHKGNVDPEIYARPFGEVYACGEPDSIIPLPETADQVQTDGDQCDDLVAYMGQVSRALAAAPVKTRQACYLPRHMRFDKERGPLIGRTQVPGLLVAAGHTCWGIQNGPATGLLVAEMLLDGAASSADIASLDPAKFKV